MKFKGVKAALGLALSAALLLGACTSDDGGVETTTGAGSGGGITSEPCRRDLDSTVRQTADGDVKFTVGPGDWNGYNAFTSKTYSTYNSVVSDRMISKFTYFGADGTICDNKDLGSYQVVSENPLVVKYTINEKAVWSDGTPVTVNDVLLEWAAQNPEFLVPGLVNGKDPNAKPLFEHVGDSFAKYIPEGPQGEVGGKTFTVRYSQPNPDYKLIVGSYLLPAHVVAKKSGLTPEQLAQAILKRDKATVTKTANFWNTGWFAKPGQLPADMNDVPSMGPYKLKKGGWTAGQSVTLEANDKYWGTPAGTKNLIVRFIEDKAQPQALQNGDVQAIQPQGTVDLVGQLESIGSSVNVQKHAEMSWEHLDFNFRPNNIFSDAPGKGGIKLRQAFALCLPRQQIVDTLVKPINPESVVMNAREVFPFQKDYQDVASASYNGEYDKVDIDKAKSLVKESGVRTPIKVRVGYRSGNQRRTDTVAAIAASCKEAGFEVQDTNSQDFFDNALVNGDYEVALFAWSGSGQITSGENFYVANKPQNYGKYSDAEVAAAWEKLTSTLDRAEQLKQIKIIEKRLWATLGNIPLYAHPGVTAFDANLKNVRATAAQDKVAWGAAQWQSR